MKEETKMKIEEDFETDPVAYEIRGLLCNGTMDCENSPECPDGTDGCVALEIYKLHKAKIAQAEKDVLGMVAENIKEIEIKGVLQRLNIQMLRRLR